MDSVGAVIGPLLAAPVLLAVEFRSLFAVSLLPGLGAALAVLVLVRAAPRVIAARPTLHGSMRSWPPIDRSAGPLSASGFLGWATSRPPC